MTYEEALKAIESLIRCAQFAQTDYVDGVDGVLLDVCKEALEKQIPMKPRQTRYSLMCFNCGHKITEKGCAKGNRIYCKKCGQKIDWSV